MTFNININTVIVAATQTLWFFLMRIGEVATAPGEEDVSDALKDEQVELRRGNAQQ